MNKVATNDNQAVKRNQSSMQVLKTLQLLLEDNYTMSELIEKLNEKEDEPIFNNSVVSKYINTCRHCGIDIPKIHNKYFVANLPFGLDLSVRDLDLLEKMQYTAQHNMTSKPNKLLDKFLFRLNKYSNKSIVRVEKKTAELTYEIFDKAVREHRRIVLMFRAKALLECIPISMSENKGKTYFNIIYNGKEKSIDAERISGIEILDKRFKESEASTQLVIFTLKGDLSTRYTLREHEQLLTDNRPEYITVSNTGENKAALLSRLLRYDTSCEIENPVNYRDEMKAILNNMLSSYGE